MTSATVLRLLHSAPLGDRQREKFTEALESAGEDQEKLTALHQELSRLSSGSKSHQHKVAGIPATK